MPWSPLARGQLAGTRGRAGERRGVRAETDTFQDALYGRPEDFDVIDRVAEVAAARGVPPAQVALAWLLHKPAVVPIVGATREGHIADARAATELGLSDEEIASLEAPYVAERRAGPRLTALAPGARYERIDMLSYQVLKASPAGAGLLYWALRSMNPLKGGRA